MTQPQMQQQAEQDHVSHPITQQQREWMWKATPARDWIEAQITRLVDDSFAYLVVDNEAHRSLCFTADTIEDYCGESWDELGVRVGTRVKVRWSEDTGTVLDVAIPSIASDGSEGATE